MYICAVISGGEIKFKLKNEFIYFPPLFLENVYFNQSCNAADSAQIIRVVCVCVSPKRRYSFVALIVKLHLESRYKVTFLELSFIEWNALDSNEPTV